MHRKSDYLENMQLFKEENTLCSCSGLSLSLSFKLIPRGVCCSIGAGQQRALLICSEAKGKTDVPERMQLRGVPCPWGHEGLLQSFFLCSPLNYQKQMHTSIGQDKLVIKKKSFCLPHQYMLFLQLQGMPSICYCTWSSAGKQ